MGKILKNLWVKVGFLSLPAKKVPFWGLSEYKNKAQLPGPLIEAKVNDSIRINLFNNYMNLAPIGEPVSLIFPGQENIKAKHWPSKWFKPAQPQYLNGKLISFIDFVEPANYDDQKMVTYQFRATKPGIYIYESGTRCEKQIQMGIYGTILIRPENYNQDRHSRYKTAYGVGTGSEFDVEKVMVLGEIDSVMHENISVNKSYDIMNFKPDCWLINGRSFPYTVNAENSSSQPYSSQIYCKVGDRVLLRIINASFNHHTFHFGGLVGRVIAEDSFSLVNSGLDASYETMGITLGAGESVDVILTPITSGDYYLYDREYNHLVNDDQFPGGMMTQLKVLI